MPYRPRVRETPSLNSWIYCFVAYVAVRSRDPQTRDLLAYCRHIIQEALRHGGNGWQEYDRFFCRKAAIDTTLQWNTQLPGLQASTFVGLKGVLDFFCTICREPDHSAPQSHLRAYRWPDVRPYQHPVGLPGPLVDLRPCWARGIAGHVRSRGPAHTSTNVAFANLATGGSNVPLLQKGQLRMMTRMSAAPPVTMAASGHPQGERR